MTTKSGLRSRQQGDALFAQGGQIVANASKGLGSSNTAEAPGDLLLHFDHPKISLGQIVVNIHTQIREARMACWCLGFEHSRNQKSE